MSKKTILFLIANIPLSLLLFYLLAFTCSLVMDPFQIMGMVGFLCIIFSVIIIAIDLVILKRLESMDTLTVFLCVIEVLSVAFAIYLWQRDRAF